MFASTSTQLPLEREDSRWSRADDWRRNFDFQVLEKVRSRTEIYILCFGDRIDQLLTTTDADVAGLATEDQTALLQVVMQVKKSTRQKSNT